MKTSGIFRAGAAGLCIAITFSLAQGSYAGNLVQNGDFESTTAGTGQLGYNTEATDWSTSSYNFLYEPGTADTVGAYCQYSSTYGNLLLWGPNDPSPSSANGLTPTSPAGGNFVALSGNWDVGPLSQTITGLTPGATYSLSFYWAAAQQWQIYGASSEQIDATFGSQSQLTGVEAIQSMGFSGWMEQTFTYTATSASEVLSFQTDGIDGADPEGFGLLGGVILQETVPDATPTAKLLGLTAAGLGIGACRKRRPPALIPLDSEPSF